MARVITFSQTFPHYHPKAGQPTFFVEKIWNSLFLKDFGFRKIWNQANYITTYSIVCDLIKRLNPELYQVGLNETFIKAMNLDCDDLKFHTVREGHRFKAGDYFSPRVWSCKSYQSKQIQFAPDMQIKNTFDLDIIGTDWHLDGRHEYTTGWNVSKEIIANNDGLSRVDFYDWFTESPDFRKKQEFHGQIICWNENINY